MSEIVSTASDGASRPAVGSRRTSRSRIDDGRSGRFTSDVADDFAPPTGARSSRRDLARPRAPAGRAASRSPPSHSSTRSRKAIVLGDREVGQPHRARRRRRGDGQVLHALVRLAHLLLGGAGRGRRGSRRRRRRRCPEFLRVARRVDHDGHERAVRVPELRRLPIMGRSWPISARKRSPSPCGSRIEELEQRLADDLLARAAEQALERGVALRSRRTSP